LIIALNKNGFSKGLLYVDDGMTYEFQKGGFTNIEFEFVNCSLFNRVLLSKYDIPSNGHLIEKLVILGPLQNIEQIDIIAKLEQHVDKDLFQQNPHSLIVKTMPLRLSINHNFQVKKKINPQEWC